MMNNPENPRRRSIRLSGYDYSQPGAYFITLVTQGRECLFGEVVDGQMRLNALGEIVREEWEKTATIRAEIELGSYVIMPNHFHGNIWIIEGRGTARRAPTVEQFGKPVAGSIPTILRAFKSAVTARINQIRKTPGVAVWQRNYYEHVIRNEDDLQAIHLYIAANPTNWPDDDEYPG